MIKTKFRMVVLECPYDTWDDPLAQEMFSKMVSLKLAGYLKEYPYGALPLDTTDFIANHLLLCVEEKGGYEPVMASRAVSLERCDTHRLGFSPLNLMKVLGKADHEKAIQSLIDRSRKEGSALSYSSSLTVRPDFRGNKEIQTLLRATHVLYHREYGIPTSIAGGVVRFKADLTLGSVGYEPLSLDGKQLDPVEVPFVWGESTRFLVMNKISAAGNKVADENREVWDNRIVIKRDLKTPLKKSA